MESKMVKSSRLLLCAICVLGFNTASATLIDRGGGMIYDTTLNITWLQDANYAQTSGTGFGNNQGYMPIDQATNWVSGLTIGGFTDWRLPTTRLPDASCGYQSAGASGPYNWGFGCRGSEMGHLFYEDFGAAAYSSVLLGTNTANLALFINIQPFTYWSGQTFDGFGEPGWQWTFHMENGAQQFNSQTDSFFAWAVRDGDVAAVPEPGTVLLLSLGLAGLGYAKRRRARPQPFYNKRTK